MVRILPFSVGMSRKDITDHLSKLKAVLEDDDILRQYHFEDYFLIRFLYGSEFNVLTALHRIREFQYILSHHPKWLIAPNPINYNYEHINDKVFLNARDKAGRTVLAVKLGRLVMRTTSFDQQCLLFNIIMEKLIYDALNLENGICAIMDVTGFPWKLVQWLTPQNVRIGVKMIENYPVKELVIHVINKSFLLQTCVNIIWPFLSEQTKKLIKFHFTNWASLHEFVDPKYLPREYGGSGPDLDFKKSQDDILKHIDDLADKVKKNMYLRSNQKLVIQ